MRSIEQAQVATRRVQLGGAPGGHDIGLALSGGGIRSATFSVGVLRSLSRLKLVGKIDYLSTVSGGGYAGAFYCSLFVPPELRGLEPPIDSQDPTPGKKQAETLGEDPLGSELGREAISQLRQGGNYLLPAGTSDTLYAAVIALRNWLGVFLVSGVPLLALFTAINLVRIVDFPLLRDSRQIVRGYVPGTMTMGASYLWLLAGLLGPLWMVPMAWAFWMTRGAPEVNAWRDRLENALPTIVAVATALLFGFLLVWDHKLSRSGFALPAGLGTIASALLGIVYYRVARRIVTRADKASEPANLPHPPAKGSDTPATLFAKENRIRAKLGRWLYEGVLIACALIALAVLDDLGRYIYGVLFLHYAFPVLGRFALPSVPPALLSAIALVRWLLTQGQNSAFLAWPRLGPVLRRLGRPFATLLAVLLLIAIVSFWSALGAEIVWHDVAIQPCGPFPRWGEPRWASPYPNWVMPVALCVFLTLCAITLGKVRSFLNQSSLAAFYAGRLRRAYLGATNASRAVAAIGRLAVNPDSEHTKDDVDLRAYYHRTVLAPLHIINVTINETTAQSSNVIQRDRKGKSMAISPAGYSTTPGSATEGVRSFALELGEQLPLSTWVGISGAAFSTGIGQNTSLGQSLLAAIVNLRLGYWWNAPTTSELPRYRWGAADLVQSYLLREARASYEGTHTNRWYLSDGGHYENTGIYELVRRRVRFIIACDNGADPKYEFGDVVNLIRKLRIDFEAETEFVGPAELDRLFQGDKRLRAAFGTLAELAPRASAAVEQGRPSGPYATLARISYKAPADKDRPPSTLLIIKPRVSGAELPDLLRYRESNVSFPQQSTVDQFFDEAQWESYFRLGELISDTIFETRRTGPADPAKMWWPSDFTPLSDNPPEDLPDRDPPAASPAAPDSKDGGRRFPRWRWPRLRRLGG